MIWASDAMVACADDDVGSGGGESGQRAFGGMQMDSVVCGMGLSERR